jgi:hypothetical protein
VGSLRSRSDILIAFGVPANTRGYWSRDGWAELGYEPVDDAEAWADQYAGVEMPPLQESSSPTRTTRVPRRHADGLPSVVADPASGEVDITIGRGAGCRSAAAKLIKSGSDGSMCW